MTLQYTTTEQLNTKLKTRLRIEGQESLVSAGLGQQTITPGEVELIAAQKEADIDLALAQVYELPLTLASPITQRYMAQVVEAATIADLLPHKQVDPGANNQGSYRSIMFAQYQRSIKKLVQGDIVLPGETLLAGETSFDAGSVSGNRGADDEELF